MNLLIKIRSWSTSAGIILVPSTFTGWYRKRITRIAKTTDTNRSRNQLAKVDREDGSCGSGFGGVWETTVSIYANATLNNLHQITRTGKMRMRTIANLFYS